MKNKIILYLITLILIPASVITLFCKMYKTENSVVLKKEDTTTIPTTTKQQIKDQKENNIYIKINKNNNIETLNLEDYIVGVVAGEMPASFNEEALKAQAIVSRTYAMYKIKNFDNAYDVETTTDDQVYNSVTEMQEKWESDFDLYYDKIKKAVSSTKNLVMKINGDVFKSYYFAMSNGYTEDSKMVFGESTINSVSSPWDNESIKKFKVDTQFTTNEIKDKLNITSNDLNISIISRDKTNRVEKISVNGKIYTGVEFRHALTLRSTDFEITKNNDNYIITTKGYGHGVGMSQYGANGMANENYKYDEILKYYYQNIEITTI